jgi:hypothetical protein
MKRNPAATRRIVLRFRANSFRCFVFGLVRERNRTKFRSYDRRVFLYSLRMKYANAPPNHERVAAVSDVIRIRTVAPRVTGLPEMNLAALNPSPFQTEADAARSIPPTR